MNTFTNAVNKQFNTGATDNGMKAYNSAGNSLLDLFSEMGNYRESIDEKLVSKAFSEHPLYFTRLLMFNRNVRGGQKVKRMLQYVLQNIDSFTEIREYLSANLSIIPHFGYWKDFYNLENTTLWPKVLQFWCAQLVDDLTLIKNTKGSHANISLAAKFAPSERNGANEMNSRLAKEFAAHLNISPKQYRQMISFMRTHLNIVEKLMSQQRWDEIDFSKVPSVAMNNYNKAFQKHVPTQYEEWVNDDTVKVNVTGITPVEIVSKSPKYGKVAPLSIKQWNNLPKLQNDWNIFVVSDCSLSMDDYVAANVTALNVSHALGLYFSHQLNGPFKNLLMEFSRVAKFVKLSGNFAEDLALVRSLSDTANTNLESVFDLILTTATTNNIDQSDMPTHLLIISDMQFDSATNANRWNSYRNGNASNGYDAIETMRIKYERAGYNIPHVIFWQVKQGKTKPVYQDDKGVTLLSGWSGDILNYLFTGEYNETEQKALTPLEQMMKIIEHEDYSIINW